MVEYVGRNGIPPYVIYSLASTESFSYSFSPRRPYTNKLSKFPTCKLLVEDLFVIHAVFVLPGLVFAVWMRRRFIDLEIASVEPGTMQG